MSKGKAGFWETGETIEAYHTNEARMAWLTAAASVQHGDVVVLDTSANSQVKTSILEADIGPVFVVAQDDDAGTQYINPAIAGWFQGWGVCPQVNLMSAATTGDWLVASTTAKLAKPVTSGSLPPTGAFGRAVTTGSTPEAFLFGSVYSRDGVSAVTAASKSITLTAGSYVTGGGDLTADRRFDFDHATFGTLLAGTFYTESEIDARTLTAGSYLTGGGDLSADRRFDFDHATLGTLLAGSFYTETEVDTFVALAASRSISLTAGSALAGGGDLTADRSFAVDGTLIDHDTLSGFVANEHIDHTGVTLTAGSYLTGGGDLSVNRRFDFAHATLGTLLAGSFYTETEVDTFVALAASKSITLTGGTGIDTIGDLSADRTINIDTAATLVWTGVHTFTASHLAANEVRAAATHGLKLYNDAGTAGIFVQDNGRVGFGTTTPGAILETSQVVGVGALFRATGGYVSFEMRDQAATNQSLIDWREGVGAGTVNARLNVFSTGHGSTPKQWTFENRMAGGDIRFLTTSAATVKDTRLFVGPSGNVGIGTTAPSTSLHVAGVITAATNIDVHGNIGLAASHYINWGDTDGASGYGFYDNAGTLQYKSSGGAWTNIAAAASGAPLDAQYVVLTGDATLTAERVLAAGSWMLLASSPAAVTLNVNHALLGTLLAGTFYTETEVDTFVALAASKSLTLTAGSYVTGGGDLSADRRFDFDHATLGTLLAGSFYTETETDALLALISASGVPESRTLTAGSFMSGGGDLTTDRRFDFDHAALGTLLAGSFYTETEVDTFVALAASRSITLTAGSHIAGGGDLTTDRRFDVTAGIADTNVVKIDDADAAENDYAKLTTKGVVGRSYAEVLSDLSEEADAEFLFNTQQVGGVVDPTTDQQAATKKYVDDNASATPAVAGVGYALVSDGVNSWAAATAPTWVGVHSFTGAGIALTGLARRMTLGPDDVWMEEASGTLKLVGGKTGANTDHLIVSAVGLTLGTNSRDFRFDDNDFIRYDQANNWWEYHVAGVEYVVISASGFSDPDQSHYVHFKGDDLVFKDVNTAEKTLTQLAAAGAGTVDTTGTPVDDDYAKFTDADTIEGRSYAEVKTDLSLNNVENTALSTWAGTTNVTSVGDITVGGANKRITFDTNDYLEYDTTNNRYAHFIGSASPPLVSATGYHANYYLPLDPALDDAYIHYDTAATCWRTYVGDTQVMAASASGLCIDAYVNAGSGYKVDGTQVYQFTPGFYTSAAYNDVITGDVAATTLDTSTVFGIPASVKAVSVRLIFRDENSAGKYIALRKGGTTNTYMGVYSQVANVWNENDGIVECDANGDINYIVSAVSGHFYIQIMGYWI